MSPFMHCIQNRSTNSPGHTKQQSRNRIINQINAFETHNPNLSNKNISKKKLKHNRDKSQPNVKKIKVDDLK